MEDSVNKRPTQQHWKTNEEGLQTVFCKSLWFIFSIIRFFILTQESFLSFRHFENVVRCFVFQRQMMTFPPWQRNNVINVIVYANLLNKPSTKNYYRIVYTFIVLTIIYLIQTYIGFGGREFMRQDHKEDSKRV